MPNYAQAEARLGQNVPYQETGISRTFQEGNTSEWHLLPTETNLVEWPVRRSHPDYGHTKSGLTSCLVKTASGQATEQEEGSVGT